MTRFGKQAALFGGAALLALAGGGALWAGTSTAQPEPLLRAGGQLASFRSDAEFRAFLDNRKKELEERERKAMLEQLARQKLKQCPNGAVIPLSVPCPTSPTAPYPPPPPPPPAPPPAPQAESSAAMDSATPVVVTGSRASGPSNRNITNTQEKDVDEGGIVKAVGDYLVVLRRGRIFTIDTRGKRLRPVDYIDAMPPGVSGGGDWYDEMLVKGDRIVVVGYSYSRGGTEVNRFRMSPDGRLRFEDAYHLRSNDYYSSRNYASRLIGNRLVYYTPLYFNWRQPDPYDSFPALRRWTGDEDAAFTPIAAPRRTYIVPQLRDDPEAPIDTLHSVVDCDLTAPTLKCDATAVIGPGSRIFYVSGNAVYLWVSDAWHRRADQRGGARSFVYRLPLDPAEAPSAIAARGAPTDQFSFREDRQNGLLDVLVRAQGGGDAMWNPEVSGGDVALLSIPLRWFGDGSREVAASRYRALPNPGTQSWNFQNRFVGNHVLYAGGEYDGDKPTTLVAAALRGGPVATMQLPHAVSRLDQLGVDAVAIGADRRQSLNFSAVDLTHGMAQLGNRFTMPAAREGESRSQAFFYRPDNADGSSGVLGLPIAREVERRYRRLFGSAASILFLKRDQRRFRLAGELEAQVEGARDDACKASCVDWYGNARPIFWDEGRVFALLGYELVEGRLANGRIGEVGRVNFAPQPKRTDRR